MIVVDRKRRRGIDEGPERPPIVLPWRKLAELLLTIAAATAGVLTWPIRRVWSRSKGQDVAQPSAEELFNARLAELDAHNRTMGYLLQASVAKLDMLVHPQPRVAPLAAPRSTIAASLRVKRARHTGPSSIKSHRGVMGAALVLLVIPAVLLSSVVRRHPGLRALHQRLRAARGGGEPR